MKKLGFDPGAEFEFYGHRMLLEAVLERLDDGRVRVRFIDEDGDDEGYVTFRPDFLAEFVAQARASEQSAA